MRSASATIRDSSAIRSSGSTSAAVCATEFLSRPSVWNIWTSGAPHVSRSASPATPDSQ